MLPDELHLNTDNKFIWHKTFATDHNVIATGLLQTNESRKFGYASETSGNASSSLGDPTSGSAVVSMGSGNSMTRNIGRSEERRAGKECVTPGRSSWATYLQKNTK